MNSDISLRFNCVDRFDIIEANVYWRIDPLNLKSWSDWEEISNGDGDLIIDDLEGFREQRLIQQEIKCQEILNMSKRMKLASKQGIAEIDNGL